MIAWFVLGYAWYAAVFAVAASLVSRQEDLATGCFMPTSMVLIVAVLHRHPGRIGPSGGLLARVTSYIPGLSPLVMPVRAQAAGEVAPWEVGLSVVLMVVAIVPRGPARPAHLLRRPAAHGAGRSRCGRRCAAERA